MAWILTGGPTISYPCDGKDRCYVQDFVSKNEALKACQESCAADGKTGGALKCFCGAGTPIYCGTFLPGGPVYNHLSYETCICKCNEDCWLFDN